MTPKQELMDFCLENFPSDDEVREAAEKDAERNVILYSDSEWYAIFHGFVHGVEWLKNYLAEKTKTKER